MPPKRKRGQPRPYDSDSESEASEDENEKEEWKKANRSKKKDRPYYNQWKGKGGGSAGKAPPLPSQDIFEAEPEYDSVTEIQERPRNTEEKPLVRPFSAGQCGPDYTVCCIGKRREVGSIFLGFFKPHPLYILVL